MRKHLEWWTLVLLGLILLFVGVPIAGDIVGGGLATLGDILLIVGVIMLFTKLFKKKNPPAADLES